MMKDLKKLREHPKLADDFNMLCDFYLMEELREPETEGGRLSYTMPARAFAGDGSGGEYHLLEDGSVGYHSSEGETGRLADSLEAFFRFLVNCPCWHDFCHVTRYRDTAALEAYGQSVRRLHREEYDEDLGEGEPYDRLWSRVAEGLGAAIDGRTAPALEGFRSAALRQPRYRSFYREDDGSLTESESILYPPEWEGLS